MSSDEGELSSDDLAYVPACEPSYGQAYEPTYGPNDGPAHGSADEPPYEPAHEHAHETANEPAPYRHAELQNAVGFLTISYDPMMEIFFDKVVERLEDADYNPTDTAIIKALKKEFKKKWYKALRYWTGPPSYLSRDQIQALADKLANSSHTTVSGMIYSLTTNFIQEGNSGPAPCYARPNPMGVWGTGPKHLANIFKNSKGGQTGAATSETNEQTELARLFNSIDLQGVNDADPENIAEAIRRTELPALLRACLKAAKEDARALSLMESVRIGIGGPHSGNDSHGAEEKRAKDTANSLVEHIEKALEDHPDMSELICSQEEALDDLVQMITNTFIAALHLYAHVEGKWLTMWGPTSEAKFQGQDILERKTELGATKGDKERLKRAADLVANLSSGAKAPYLKEIKDLARAVASKRPAIAIGPIAGFIQKSILRSTMETDRQGPGYGGKDYYARPETSNRLPISEDPQADYRAWPPRTLAEYGRLDAPLAGPLEAGGTISELLEAIERDWESRPARTALQTINASVLLIMTLRTVADLRMAMNIRTDWNIPLIQERTLALSTLTGADEYRLSTEETLKRLPQVYWKNKVEDKMRALTTENDCGPLDKFRKWIRKKETYLQPKTTVHCPQCSSKSDNPGRSIKLGRNPGKALVNHLNACHRQSVLNEIMRKNAIQPSLDRAHANRLKTFEPKRKTAQAGPWHGDGRSKGRRSQSRETPRGYPEKTDRDRAERKAQKEHSKKHRSQKDRRSRPDVAQQVPTRESPPGCWEDSSEELPGGGHRGEPSKKRRHRRDRDRDHPGQDSDDDDGTAPSRYNYPSQSRSGRDPRRR